MQVGTIALGVSLHGPDLQQEGETPPRREKGSRLSVQGPLWLLTGKNQWVVFPTVPTDPCLQGKERMLSPPQAGEAAPGALTSISILPRARGSCIPGYFNAAELSVSLSPFILAFVQKKQM